MTSYKVIYPFRDLQDVTKKFPTGRIYGPEDAFPATKRKVSDERLNELLTSENRLRRPVIVKVKGDA